MKYAVAQNSRDEHDEDSLVVMFGVSAKETVSEYKAAEGVAAGRRRRSVSEWLMVEQRQSCHSDLILSLDPW